MRRDMMELIFTILLYTWVYATCSAHWLTSPYTLTHFKKFSHLVGQKFLLDLWSEFF